MLSSAKNFVLDLLFPPLCLTCEQHLKDGNQWTNVCDNCLESPPKFDHLSCPVCLARIPNIENHCHPKARYLLAAATTYDHPVVKKLLWQFKYEGWQSLARPLAEILINQYRDIICPNILLVPLPLHKRRQRQRGFNQSELLAETISHRLSVVWSKDNLIKIKNTASQTELADYSAREENVQNAFAVNDPEEFKGKDIILVDDIFTSGATVSEAARVLKLSGAKKIIALVVARAR